MLGAGVLEVALGCDPAGTTALDVLTFKAHAAVVALVVAGCQLVGQCFGLEQVNAAPLKKGLSKLKSTYLRI